MMPRVHSALLFALLLTGCAIGPDRLTSSRMAYNEAVQVTEQRELLLNIVRLRYHETPEFLTISGISSQFELVSSLTVGGELNEDGDLVSVPEASLGFAERPTITFSPRQGLEFTRQLTAPIGPETVYRLIEYGWGLERVFDLAVRRINDVGAAIGQARETSGRSATPALARSIDTLAALQRRGKVTLRLHRRNQPVSPPLSAEQLAGVDIVAAAQAGYRLLPKNGGYVLAERANSLALKLEPDVAETTEWRTLAKQLGLSPQHRTYEIDLIGARDGPGRETDRTLYLATRSPLEIMAHLAQGVAVPEAHRASGRVSAAGSSVAVPLRVATSPAQPSAAYMAVRHRDRWFYVRGDDLDSRRSLGLLISLLRLELEAGGAENLPVLTLPVGQ